MIIPSSPHVAAERHVVHGDVLKCWPKPGVLSDATDSPQAVTEAALKYSSRWSLK